MASHRLQAPSRCSDAPQQSAPTTRIRRRGALEIAPEPLVALPVPDRRERLAEGVAENQSGVVPRHPRRDAARQDIAVGRDVGKRPRALAPGPWARAVATALQAGE